MDVTEVVSEAVDSKAGAGEPASRLPPPAHVPWRRDPVVAGTFLCIASAVGYTATNICLREVATGVDPFWVSCIKAVPTVVVAIALIAGRVSRGLPVAIDARSFWALVAVGLLAQIGGNAAFQWTLKAIGLALAVPIANGAMMISGAIAGRVALGESVTPRATIAMTVLIGAIVVLSAGAGDASASIESLRAAPSIAYVAGGVALACFSGFSYAMLSVVIRRVSRPDLPLSTMLLVVCATGVVSLGAATLMRGGASIVTATTASQWQVMVLAGVFNAAAFFALSKALRLVSVMHVNLVNASQVAMAAIAGVAWFGEARTEALGLGVALTVLGMLVIRRR